MCMKRFTKILMLTAALPMLLAGCMDNEIMDVNTSSSDYIGFNSNTAVTRASITTLATLQDDDTGFKVYAAHGNDSDWYADVDGIKIDGTNNYKHNAGSWNFIVPVKWPASSSDFPMKFYAHYPATPDEGLGTLTSQGGELVAHYTVLPAGHQVDLLASTTTVNSRPASGVVPLVFRHILSQVDFGIIAGAGTMPFIQSMHVDSVEKADMYNFTSQSWMGHSKSGDGSYPYFGSLSNAVVLPVFSPAVCDDNTPNAIYSGAHKNHLMLLPQTSSSWQPSDATPAGGFISVIYRMETGHSTGGFGTSREVGFASATSHPDYAVHGAGYTGPLFVKAGFPLPQDASHNFTWDMGRRYIYNIGLGTRSSCNGYILDEYYYDDQGRRTALRLIEVRNEGKHTGDKLQDGNIHVTLDIDEWNDGSGGEIHPGSLSISPSFIYFNELEQKPAQAYLIVTSIDGNGNYIPTSWTLNVPANAQSWLKISTSRNSNFGSASTSLSTPAGSTGLDTIYLYAPSNSAAKLREGIITLTKNASNTVVGSDTVRQSGTSALSSGAVSDYGSCVGAFWKHDEIGERIVKIVVPSSGAGKWMATIVKYDGRWDAFNGDGVLFSSDRSPDPQINTTNPNDAELYNLLGQGYTSSVSGMVKGDDTIYFRIGLQKKFAAFSNTPNYRSTFPARYAVIELLYKDYKMSQRLYLRQGEGDDYVISANAPNNRANAKRFSPYNLTSSGTLNTQIALRGGTFVTYPTMGGAIFQFASNYSQYQRIAYDNFTPRPSSWSSVVSAAFDPKVHETCPSGYVRPKDDATVVSYSQMKSSLWVSYSPSYSQPDVVKHNYLFGSYSDGYYDRRPAVKNSDPNYPSFTYSVVARGTRYAAYEGGLFYNPQTCASLFFPAGGMRSANDGSLSPAGVGYQAYYATSSQNDANPSYNAALYLDIDEYYKLRMSSEIYNTRASGFLIRCVRE